MTTTTNETITVAQIKTLKAEAAAAGDVAMVHLCERAELAVYDPARGAHAAPQDGPDAEAALDAVVDAIAAAEAQAE